MRKTVCLILTAFLLLNMLCGCQNDPAPTAAPTTYPQPTHTEGTLSQMDPTASVTEPTVYVEPMDVVVSEVMADNEKLCLGHEHDWVELYNREETAVDLEGYWLTDDPLSTQALSLSGLRIDAGEYLVIVLDEDAPFRLSSAGESVYLVCGGNVISELSFGAVNDGESMDASGACPWPTPGFANTQEGYLSYLNTLELPQLMISEAMSSNSEYLPVEGECYDLVELKNNSSQPLSLLGYYLSDKRSEPNRYALPDVTLQPGEYYVIYCSGSPELGNDHASFKLSADGESLYLSKDGSFVDVLTVPAQLPKNESFGRDGKVPGFLSEPSFGQKNPVGYLTNLEAPQASLPSGVYADTVMLSLSAEGDIYYTLDGSRPGPESEKYTQPIALEGAVTVRTFCISGDRVSDTVSYTYLTGQQHSLPVVVVSIPKDCLTGRTGVLDNIRINYEYEAVATLLENGTEQFSVPCGFRLHGYGSRNCDKQNFQLRFRSEYGVGKLEYKLFEDLELDSFNSLLLKGGSEDWFGAVMRDEVCTMVARDTNVYTQAMKPVVLYLGGEYWGVYYIRERFSDDYVASHLGVSEESVDIVEASSAMVQCGSNKDFLALREYCESHDMSREENFAWLAERIDVLSLVDWYICRAYTGDRDINNIRRFRSQESDGLWRWMYFDLDWAFYNSETYFSDLMYDYGADRTLIRAVIASETGRDLFLKRCAELLRTKLNEASFNAVIDSIVTQVDPEMVRDRERWGYSYEKWQNYVQKMRQYVADDVRQKGFMEDLRSYFGLTDDQMEAYFAGLS